MDVVIEVAGTESPDAHLRGLVEDERLDRIWRAIAPDLTPGDRDALLRWGRAVIAGAEGGASFDPAELALPAEGDET